MPSRALHEPESGYADPATRGSGVSPHPILNRLVRSGAGYLVVLLLLLVSATRASAQAVPYQSYTYDYWKRMVPSPHAYVPVGVVYGEELGIGALKGPQDIFVTSLGEIYIADSGNNRILHLDDQWHLVQEIRGFTNAGKADRFGNPRGIHVLKDGTILVADRDNGRVVVLTGDGELIRTIGSPAKDQPEYFTTDFRFKPDKVSADPQGAAGSIYVISAGVYDGIMEFNLEGRFMGFKGAPRVTPSLADIIWRRIGTKAQRERMALFLPVEHSNLSVDGRGFIYATAVGGSITVEETIRRLNTSGSDVLRRAGSLPPVGDFLTPASTFVDVVPQKYDMYSLLDKQRGHVFTYDSSGNLLYAFGSLGDQLGTFRSPVAIAEFSGKLLVLDAVKNNITIFEPTEYQRLIYGAIQAYQFGRFAEAAALWSDVLSRNANFDLAYTGIGNTLLMQGEYTEAMENFRLANDRKGYSDALRFYRQDQLERYFGWILSAVAVVVLYLLFRSGKRSPMSSAVATEQAAAAHAEVRQWEEMPRRSLGVNVKRVLRGLQYALHVVVSPLDGFWDLKHEKRGNVPTAVTLVVMVVVTYLAMLQYTGFPFNTRNPRALNLFAEAFSIVVPFLLWCAINWSLTTLMNGKGSFKEIVIASAYALTPVVLILVPLTVVSNVMTSEEGAFYYLFIAFALAWSMALLFVGTMMVHEYSFGGTIAVSILILIGIGVALFVGLLFIDLVLQFIGFFNEVYHEFVFRL